MGYSPRGRKESDMTERLHFLSYSSVTTMLLRSKSTEKKTATKREVYKLMADLFVNAMTVRSKFFSLLL